MRIELSQPYLFLHMGRRSNQEDARYPDEDCPQPFGATYIVCDGVGGQDKGEVASNTVTATLGKYMHRYGIDRPFSDHDFSKALGAAYAELDRKFATVSKEMATTLTFVHFHSEGVFAAYIGDSRIYQIRPGVGILYRSDDHSLVNSLVHSGNITPQKGIDHPKGNVITNCMGYEEDGQRATATTINLTDIEAGDYFFLCSDGVLHQVDDAQLYDILTTDCGDRQKMLAIAELSKDSVDNNTAALIRVESVEKEYGEDGEYEDSDKTDLTDPEEETASEGPTIKLEIPGPVAGHSTCPDRESGNGIVKLFKRLFG